MSKAASYNPLDRPLTPYFRPLAGTSESSRQQRHVADDTNIEPEWRRIAVSFLCIALKLNLCPPSEKRQQWEASSFIQYWFIVLPISTVTHRTIIKLLPTPQEITDLFSSIPSYSVNLSCELKSFLTLLFTPEFTLKRMRTVSLCCKTVTPYFSFRASTALWESFTTASTVLWVWPSSSKQEKRALWQWIKKWRKVEEF